MHGLLTTHSNCMLFNDRFLGAHMLLSHVLLVWLIMSDEKPVAIKKLPKIKARVSSKPSTRCCVVHYDRNVSDHDIRPILQKAFDTICTSVGVRSQQSICSPHRLEEICCRIPTVFDSDLHGAHRWCYKNFTNISHLFLGNSSSSTEPPAKRTRVERSASSAASTIFPGVCLFCGTVRKFVKGKRQILRRCQTKDAEATIRWAATEKEDFELLGRITGCDLIAKEAVYHPAEEHTLLELIVHITWRQCWAQMMCKVQCSNELPTMMPFCMSVTT